MGACEHDIWDDTPAMKNEDYITRCGDVCINAGSNMCQSFENWWNGTVVVVQEGDEVDGRLSDVLWQSGAYSAYKSSSLPWWERSIAVCVIRLLCYTLTWLA